MYTINFTKQAGLEPPSGRAYYSNICITQYLYPYTLHSPHKHTRTHSPTIIIINISVSDDVVRALFHITRNKFAFTYQHFLGDREIN